MKTIQVSDEDFKTLMELSKELQIQENDSQAFPYFWSPRSTKHGIGTEDGEKVFFLDEGLDTAEELFDNDDLREQYLNNNKLEDDADFVDINLDSWEEFLEEKKYGVHYRREEKIQENNFSLFKSDVKHHIKCNAYHLGKNPHTYANTISRMYNMERLIKCLYRLNPQSKETTNHEAFIYRGK